MPGFKYRAPCLCPKSNFPDQNSLDFFPGQTGKCRLDALYRAISCTLNDV